MRDYVVTKVGAGTLNFLPRVVRCDTPREAAVATVMDLYWDEEAADEGFRQLPPHAPRSTRDVTRFKYQDGVLQVWARRDYLDIWDKRLVQHVRIRKDGSHVSTARLRRGEQW